MSRTLFIADLHLSDDTPELTALLLQSLQQWQGKIDALYILGDLFDVWVGDDAPNQTADTVALALKRLSQTTPIYFICGNRDFLMGKHFLQRSGMQKLPAQTSIEVNGKKILLTHGDEMCTDDTAYLRFRFFMRQKWLQKILLSLPLTMRLKIAAKMRAASRRRQQSLGLSPIADVTEAGVLQCLNAFSDCEIIIHGHTHRPATHSHSFKNRNITRHVLPDWHGKQGGCLSICEDALKFETLILSEPK